ncbi:SGNH/GDSL hydrolase family protein, partial [Providencia rettgeri]
IDEIEKTGALPVLLASGPSWRADSDRSKKELLFETNTIKKDIAAQRGIPFIDKAALMTEWLETNVEYPWLVLEADGLHFNDDGHRVQASLIAAELFSGLIKIENEKDVQHISFMDNRVVCPIGYGGHYNTQTPRFPNILFTKNYLNSNLGQEVLTFWFKVKNDSTAMFYNAIRNEGITNIANPINTKLVNLCTNKEIVNAPSPNQGFLPSSTNGDNGSFPLLLDVLNHGIYKISITLPAVTDTFPKGAFLGYFSFYPKWQRTPLGSSIVKTINPIYHRVGDISGTRELFYKGVTPDGENHWGLGWKVKKSTLFFKASLSKLAGLGILDFEGVNAKTDDRYKTIGMFKDEKDGLALLILNLGQRGGASSSTNPDTAFSCGTLADGEEKEFKFVLEKTESGV